MKNLTNQDILDQFWNDVNDIANDYAVKHCIVPPDAYKPSENIDTMKLLLLKAFMNRISGGFCLGSGVPRLLNPDGICPYISITKIFNIFITSKNDYQLSIKDITILETPDVDAVITKISEIVGLNADEFEN